MSFMGVEYSPPNQWMRYKNGFNTLFFPSTVFTGVPKAGCSNWMEALMFSEGVLKDHLRREHVNDVHSVYAGPFRMISVRKKLTLQIKGTTTKFQFYLWNLGTNQLFCRTSWIVSWRKWPSASKVYDWSQSFVFQSWQRHHWKTLLTLQVRFRAYELQQFYWPLFSVSFSEFGWIKYKQFIYLYF